MEEAGQIFKFVRLGGIPTAMLILLVAWLSMQVIHRMATQIGNRLVERRLLIHQIVTIVSFIMYIGAFVAVVPVVFSLTKEMMIALGGTIALTVGFALKDLAASVIAGIILLVDKPFQVGDRVTFDHYYGEIVSIGLRSVRLVTLDDSLVTIPNNKFLSDSVSSSNAGELNMLVQQDFFIGVDQDLATAKRIVQEAITSCPYAYLDKPWTVLVNEVIQEQYFALRLRAKVYVMDVRYEKMLESDVTERIVSGFAEAGIKRPAILYRNMPESATEPLAERQP